MPDRVKVAILGAGCGGMSAAYWLSANRALRERYEITVYTHGWRLGGKGASGRRAVSIPVDGGSVTVQRIEEHGLHLMLGFYETAFHVIRDCYASRAKAADDAFRDWTDAFEPLRQVSPMFEWPPGSGKWRPWNIDFLRLPGVPGDEPLTLPPATDYMRAALYRVRSLLINGPLAALKRLSLENAVLEKAFTAAQARPLDAALASADSAIDESEILEWVESMQVWYQSVFAPIADIPMDGSDPGFRIYILSTLVDLGLAGLKGYLKDVYFRGESGYAHINDLDFKEWLQRHGARERSVYSGFIMLLYDLAFAYVDGDSSDPRRTARVAAGAMLRLAIRMAFTYKDAPAWRMKAGMGDAIFTPLYEVLTARGVRFEFFHRVSALRVSGKTVQSIEFDRQVETRTEYRPLRRLPFGNGKRWDCWPAEPLWDQIKNGDSLKNLDLEDPWCTQSVGKRTLTRPHDFDIVIVAIPPAALQPVAGELVAGEPAWAAMFDNTHSVATHSLQLWLKPDLRGLGWPHGATVATCYADPLRSWGEMSQVLAAEGSPAEGSARSCEYLCGTYAPTLKGPPPGTNDPGYVRGETARAQVIADTWLKSNTGALWPGVSGAGGLDRRQVIDEFHRANVAWSELYVQTLPGTVIHRLAPGGSGFENAYLAGDWTRTSINGGCAEAAFESGLSAACAISGGKPPIPD